MLKINISTKNISLDEPLRVFVQEKIGSLEHFVSDMGDVSADVEIGKSSQHHHKGPFMYAEANLHVAGQLLRANCEHEDLRNAITEVKDDLKAQVTKFKEKLRDSERKQ